MGCGNNQTNRGNCCPASFSNVPVDPNSPLITGYPKNSLCFMLNDETGAYNEFANRVYRFNGTSWDLVFEPHKEYAQADFWADGGTFTIIEVKAIRNISDVQLNLLFTGTGIAGSGNVLLGTISIPSLIPASIRYGVAMVGAHLGLSTVVPVWVDTDGTVGLGGAMVNYTDDTEVNITIKYSL